MRILHTSDWHLGQYFMGKSREAEHRAFCRWLVERVREYAVDAVIIAGDVFDTGAPPSYAREQYNRFIVELRETGASLVVLGGNHDSVAMLEESRELLAVLGTRVIAAAGADLDRQLLVLPQRDGTPGAVLCAIPFLRPRDLLASQAGQSAQDKQLALQQGIQAHYQALFALAEAKRAELGGKLPIVATGHLTTVGASASESVREIYVGSLEAFPTSAFPAADYIALGHIHRPQKVGGLEHIRYCGSPIALSFDEARQAKEVLLVDLDESGLRAVTPLPVPCFQPLQSLAGDLDSLPAALAEAANLGTPERPVWVEVLVRSDDYLNDLQARLEKLCEALPVEVLRTRRERGSQQVGLFGEARETLDELSAEDVFEQRLDAEDLAPPLRQELAGLYRQVVAELQEEQA
ncbi:exonuclease subunit SbcD [Pseudomonas citronellolis]|uniref:exonuclease subunit SbcD n=1 Tax=Pseudomonas citronellolis TaxID=53408 RepID=UPI002D7777F3|nr:exonuclease subunit SbcD [Pseudomonas citronellolis]WRT80106.1 exonuclease subunit SbcD [Pseudomonas citronellolis]